MAWRGGRGEECMLSLSCGDHLRFDAYSGACFLNVTAAAAIYTVSLHDTLLFYSCVRRRAAQHHRPPPPCILYLHAAKSGVTPKTTPPLHTCPGRGAAQHHRRDPHRKRNRLKANHGERPKTTPGTAQECTQVTTTDVVCSLSLEKKNEMHGTIGWSRGSYL